MSSQVNQGVFTPDAIQKLLAAALVAIGANGAVDPHTANRYVITKSTGIAALTLAAPTANSDDGLLLSFLSTSAEAHTLTATGLFVDGAGHVNLATWSSNAGGYLLLMAYQAKWYVLLASNVTMS